MSSSRAGAETSGLMGGGTVLLLCGSLCLPCFVEDDDISVGVLYKLE